MASPTRERIVLFWQEHRWVTIAGLWALSLGLAILGFQEYGARTDADYGATDLLYLALQLFTMNSGAVQGKAGALLDTARFLAPAVAAFTAFEALTEVLHEQITLMRLRWFRDHVILCGLGEKGLLLARAFRASGFRVVALDRDPTPSGLQDCRDLGVPVVVGDATTPHALRRARVSRARFVISVCGDDATNALVTLAAAEADSAHQEQGPLCVVHVSDPQVGHLLQRQAGELTSGHPLQYFNAFEGGARAVVSRFSVFSPTSETLSIPHFLVAGAGPFAASVIRHIARQWRGHAGGEGPACRITLLGQGAKECLDQLKTRDELRLWHCELLAEEQEWTTEDGWLHLPQRITRYPITAVVLCYTDETHALSTGLWLAQEALPATVPVVMCVRREAGLAALLQGGVGTPTQLRTFGVLDLACQPALLFPDTIEELAQAIHRDYLSRRSAGAADDPSAAEWAQLSEELRESNRRQADHILAKLQAVRCGLAPLVSGGRKDFRFTDVEVELLAQIEHGRWMAERLLSGWTHGAERSAVLKTNPLLCPWEELPAPVQEENRAQIRRLPSLLAGSGFQIYRLG